MNPSIWKSWFMRFERIPSHCHFGVAFFFFSNLDVTVSWMSLSNCKNFLINFNYWLWYIKWAGYGWKMRGESHVTPNTGKGSRTHSTFQLDSVPLQNRNLVNKRLIVAYCFSLHVCERKLWSCSRSFSLPLLPLERKKLRNAANPVTSKEGKNIRRNVIWFT